MEWSWRTVMILLGLVVMIAILVDGFRRMRRARAEALKLDVSHDFKFPEEGYNPELPGEVRVVGEVDEEPLVNPQPSVSALDRDTTADIELPAFSALDDEPVFHTNTADASTVDTGAANIDAVDPIDEFAEKEEPVSEESAVEITIAENSVNKSAVTEALTEDPAPVNLDEQVPVLLDVEELGEETTVLIESPVADSIADKSQAVQSELAFNDSTTADDRTASDFEPVAEAAESTTELADATTFIETTEPHDERMDQAQESIVTSMPEPLAETVQIITQPVNFSGSNAEILAHRPPAEVVLVIHAIARSPEGFKGSDLIYLFNSCDLRYGEKNIFHRFEEKDGEGCIQFSVSQSHEPGTFEPTKMADQNYRGLSFFMSLPGASRPLEAYEAMYEMAMVVSRNLKADVLDESESALTPQTVEANREEIMTFERHQHLLMKKQGTR
ncbi:cell division protein ZipA C-terminal FtsZ-binding domain-containing protein [Bacterioplanoides sp.]|uniref:cell division protein ZipA C-terminal FtsZ-binding domain-containing protein n=1 Tax=Bacterioplanoides sp. TaxID=2066072 RepID=UPI003BAD4178